jgi:ATP-binding cassette, subfamily B, heavy metal transporter
MHPAVHSHTAPPPPGEASLRSLGRLFPYLWEFRARVLLALALLVGAKLASVAVPLVLKEIIDALDQPRPELILPLALILGYGVLRFASTTFADLRDVIFAKVTQRAMRRISMAVFKHLHALSLRFHLERQTGGITRDIERGSKALSSLVGYLLFRITPTVLEILMVAGILFVKLDWVFGVLTLVTLAAYIGFTVTITEWRTQFVRRANTLDSEAYGRAIDSLLNYETVKYFGNEKYEAQRYDKSLVEWEDMALKSQRSLGMLNAAQAGVIAIGVTLMVLRAAAGVVEGTLTLGDLVMVNAFLLQMFQPLSFLGVMYRQIKESITDVERMFALMQRPREVEDKPDARELDVIAGEVTFDHVSFAYNPDRPILHDVSFTIPAGKTVAAVGASGAGKSTLARLLFRFYDVNAGSIRIDGQDIRHVTQDSLRAAIGVVPQDTVLFNDSIFYNIAYGRPDATREEVDRGRARRAHPAFHRNPAAGLGHRGGRARAQAFRRREAAGGDRAHAAEEPGDPDPRRGHLGARHQDRKGHPGRTAGDRPRPHQPDHRASSLHRGRGRRDPGHGRRAHRRARAPSRSAGARTASTRTCGHCSSRPRKKPPDGALAAARRAAP